MTKATRIINKYHIKEMLLNGNPQFENFYNEDLIKFCEVARELIKENNQANLLVNCIKKYKEVIDKLNKLISDNSEKYWVDDNGEPKYLFNEVRDILKEVI